MPLADPARAALPAGIPPETLTRLQLARGLLLGLEALGFLAMVSFTPADQTVLVPMLAILGLHGGLTLWMAQRRRATAREIGAGEVFAGLAVDAAVLAGLVYFSGGYANPFISLLLLPLLLCAVTLGGRHTWGMTAWVAGLYTLLARYYEPLVLAGDGRAAIDLHLAGMWLNFLVTALLVAAFLARLTATLRRREAELAQERERALRDQQLFALGMQAAAAAHDLATPLATLRLELAELEGDYAGDEELAPRFTLLRGQSERMHAVLNRLAASAGGAAAAPPRPVDEWLAETFAHWQLMRPHVVATAHYEGPRPPPPMRDDPILISVLSTLLNNAADASQAGLALEAKWDTAWLTLRVLDRGPGLDGAAGKPGGWGVGLRLAQAALERYGADLSIMPRPGGGLCVAARLPLAGLIQGRPA